MAVYVRLRSLRTGRHWDTCITTARVLLRRGGVELVSRVAPYEASRPRPGKPFTDLAGRPARRRKPGTS